MTEPAGPRDWVLGNFDYGPEEKDLYARDPAAFHKHTRALTAATMTLFDIFMRGSENQKHVRALVEAKMREDLRHNPELIDKIIPDFEVWCRRVTPCAPFIDALHRDSVTLDKSLILEVTEEGIVTAEGLKKVDHIILATGFDTSFRPRYPIEAKSKSLAEVWAKRPKCYMSVAVAGFPNLFFMCGPGTIFANGSLLAGVEANSGYIVEALNILQQQDVLTMEVNRDAQDEYNEQQDSLMEDLVFSGSCSSWYKGGDPNGKPDALFAGSTLQFIEMLSRPRWQDWHFRTLYKNRFSFLGNGTGAVEATGGDRAWYIQQKDHSKPLRTDDPLA
ncbi:phenylacetone monooxygenase [Rhodotorula toruloides]|uniref:Phenylacetone monooxygenase n=1 Tax=Rhodotorula toruloides TaxID=5286 RepID=A0A511KQY6_RHOTO|nr:phenylacetone monooxygenase [Rhodotorula toruloides]